MNVTAESHGQAVILHCKGELTADTLGAFKKAVEQQLSEPPVPDVILDLAETPFVDSATLEYLLELQDQLNEQNRLVKLVNLDENVAKILEMTRLDGVLACFQTVPEAIGTM